ncbi:hypothetical protein [Alicyclobacillus sp. SP_1]|uniref:hypothetical protein n=1 Tax=Alicyclobacillus sp. SP_1 TaxID=2942475 RepID=UPI00215891C8|nr:hypothetical protein [Alicyclobacillus sp. SP_1]
MVKVTKMFAIILLFLEISLFFLKDVFPVFKESTPYMPVILLAIDFIPVVGEFVILRKQENRQERDRYTFNFLYTSVLIVSLVLYFRTPPTPTSLLIHFMLYGLILLVDYTEIDFVDRHRRRFVLSLFSFVALYFCFIFISLHSNSRVGVVLEGVDVLDGVNLLIGVAIVARRLQKIYSDVNTTLNERSETWCRKTLVTLSVVTFVLIVLAESLSFYVPYRYLTPNIPFSDASNGLFGLETLSTFLLASEAYYVYLLKKLKLKTERVFIGVLDGLLILLFLASIVLSFNTFRSEELIVGQQAFFVFLMWSFRIGVEYLRKLLENGLSLSSPVMKQFKIC